MPSYLLPVTDITVDVTCVSETVTISSVPPAMAGVRDISVSEAAIPRIRPVIGPVVNGPVLSDYRVGPRTIISPRGARNIFYVWAAIRCIISTSTVLGVRGGDKHA